MHALAHSLNPPSRPRLSPFGLGSVILTHLLLLFGLVRMNLITLPAPVAVLTVSLLPPVPDIAPQPEVVPPKPKPVERRPIPLPQPTQLAAPAELAAPIPIAVPPAPTFTAPPAPIVAAPVAAPTQPRFDVVYLDNPKPVYPAISRRLSEQGRVLLRVHVTSEGLADDVQLHASSGSPRLDQSALDTVRRWKFVPAKLGQEPIAAWVLVPIAFTLKD